MNSSSTSAKSTANITVNNTVSGQSVVTYVGGVIGNTPSSVTSSAATNSNIEVNSRNKVYVGGVVGNCGGTITECYAYPNITVANSYVTYTGGVSGYAKKIVKSYSTSNIVSNTLGYSGGFAGENNNSTIKYCYSTGNASANSLYETAYEPYIRVGGFVGYHYGTIENCFATGNVSLTYNSTSTEPSAINYGGFAGYGTVAENCYYYDNQSFTLTIVSEGISSTKNEGGVSTTIDNFKTTSFIEETLGWSLEIWQRDSNALPTLK